MNSQERVLAACAFQAPDRIPRVEFFCEYPEAWRKKLGPVEVVNDVAIWTPNEGTFPTRARVIKQEKGDIYEVDKWGRTIRRREGAYFVETLEAPIADNRDIDTVTLGLSTYTGLWHTDYNVVTAAAFLSVIPMLIIYLFLQNFVIEGMTMTGLK